MISLSITPSYGDSGSPTYGESLPVDGVGGLDGIDEADSIGKIGGVGGIGAHIGIWEATRLRT